MDGVSNAKTVAETALAFGTQLRRYRIAAGLTQEELAERAGVSQRSISDMERGVPHTPRPDTVTLLATALDLPAPDRAAFAVAARHLGTPPPAPMPSLPSTAPFVGRTRELALIERHLAGEGPPLLLFAGDPGIGKTRLLQAAIPRALGQGLVVLEGGCQRRGGHEPYAPLQGALQRHLNSLSPTQLRRALRDCAWLVRLLPELAGGPIEALPAWKLRPEHERGLMFAAVARYLSQVAGPAGVLLLLDDLQWAGADALDLLSTLVRTATEVPLRILAAHRDTEVQSSDALAIMVADLAHAGLATRRALAPLAAPEAKRLLDELQEMGAPLEPDLQERLVQRTGGVPFFLLSCAQALRQGEGTEGADGVPWDVAHSVRQRVAALPPATWDILGAAAVAGRVVPRSVLVTAAACPEHAVLATLEAACAARLLAEADERDYQFVHDMIREVVEADLSAARRATLHRRVAEALEAGPGDPPVAALAYHYGRSDALDKAVFYLERAGDQARDRFANAAAKEYYGELVERLDQLRRDLDAARAREKLGTTLWALNQYMVALPVLKHAAETYRILGDLESVGRVTAQIGEVYTISGAPHDGLTYLQPVLEALETTAPSRGLAGLYGALARLLFVSGRYTEQQVAADRAAELARAVQDEWLLAEATWQQGLGLLARGRVEHGRRAMEETVRLTAAVGNLDILCRTLTRLATLSCGAGDLAGARSYADRAMQSAEQMGNPRSIVDTWTKYGEIAFVAGRWEDARVAYEHAVAQISQIEPTYVTAWALLGLARLCHSVGAHDEARRYLERTMAMAERVSPHLALPAAQTLLAECEALEGQAGAARERLARLLDRPGLSPRDVITAQVTLARVHVELGEATTAEAVAEQANTRARSAHETVTLVDVLQVQAMALIRQEQWVEAQSVLDEGLALARRIPYPYAEGRLLHVYGQMLVATGKVKFARDRLEAALALFRRLGAREDVMRVERAIAALSQNRASPAVGSLSQYWTPQSVATSVTDAQWAQIQELLRPSRPGPGRPRADDRRTLEAILYVQRTGSRWAELPRQFGDDATAHRRWRRWQKDGTWASICQILGLHSDHAGESNRG
jgi:tetratricopeptide (TPR) repeat protein/transcriptional regulator with XRE-family HTH domain